MAVELSDEKTKKKKIDGLDTRHGRLGESKNLLSLRFCKNSALASKFAGFVDTGT